MRFAFRRLSKAIVIGVLGCAAAILVACGDRNGLLPGDQASGLNSALDGVSIACARGRADAALDAAGRFRRDVEALSPQEVDRRLIRHLRDGASTLEELVSETCTEVPETVPTQTTIETAPPAETPTTPQTTPTTPQTTPPPSDGDGETTTPSTPGGGTTTPPSGGTPGTGGGTPGGSGGDTGGGTDSAPPEVNPGNPGGALAPGQGGTTP